MAMSCRWWLQKLGRKLTGVTIELVAQDRFALGSRICNLTAAELAAVQWSDALRSSLYSGLMRRNPKGYAGWHPGKEALVPVTLRKSEWRMIERLCANLMRAKPEDWQVRVVERIRTFLPLPSEPADRR